jgi:hypothetical protein
MASDLEHPEKNSPPFDPEYQTENIAFDAGELIECDGCSRANPPNRLNCLYCGGELDVPIDGAVSIASNRRKLEIWERGFNVIVLQYDERSDISEIAKLLSMDAASVAMILSANTPLPVARVEGEREASIVSNRLSALGVRCLVIRDEEFRTDKPPVRVSGLDDLYDRFALKDFNTGAVTQIAKNDLVLIVTGTFNTRTVDSLEKKRLGKESKLLNETTTIADEAIIDIYTRDDPSGFRIRMAGFDFSCLGEDKGMMASENMRSLIIFLKGHAPNARFVNNYSVVRHALGIVWELEERRESKGMQRAGFGKAELGIVATTNNVGQFTKYSRLQWHLL